MMKMNLQEIVAHFCGCAPAEIVPDFPLSRGNLQGSLKSSLLIAAIRRHLGINILRVSSARTFRDLEALVAGQPVSGSTADLGNTIGSLPTSPEPQLQLGPSITCGIDIESVDDLPMPTDYWEHEFYRDSFSRDEIAYCLTKPNPTVHFAGRWCAKESLKKCDATFANEKLANLEVIQRNTGEIVLCHRRDGKSHPLPHAVSITHTESMAVAVVVKMSPQARKIEPPVSRLPTDDSTSSDASANSKLPTTYSSMIISLLALGLSIFALLRPLH